MKREYFKSLALGFTFLVLIFTVYLAIVFAPKKYFQISFFDVGQGDAIFIQTKNHTNILIDGGPDNKVSKHLSSKLNYFEKDIDMVFATHDDLDHIFGLIKVLENYNVKVLFVSVLNSKNTAMKELLKIAKYKNVRVVQIQKPSIIKTSDGLILKILFPTFNAANSENGNDASIVTQVIFGKNKILLTGDLGIDGENYLIQKYGDSLKSDILKLGHHGSDTSTHPNFLQNVSPQVAIVSAGLDNKFGHPHISVLKLLEKFNISVLETAKEGNINFNFEGENIWRE